MKKELLIGSGPSRVKKVLLEGQPPTWENLTTLDMDPECGADVVWDLNQFPYPFEDNSFDEVHAYEVLEHLGQQGDFRFFFKQFEELWRILKPDGGLFATVPGPKSPWVWGDPGHTRVITLDMLSFLDQDFYALKENGQPKYVQSTYYQKIYKGNFKIMGKAYENNEWTLLFMLRAVK